MSGRVERLLTPIWVRVVGLALLALGLTLYLYWPAISIYPALPWGDGQYTHRLVEAAKVSMRRYHELPLWDPFECAGRPLWDEPESIVASPLLFLMQPLSTTVTMRLWNILHHVTGFICMWLLARHELRLSRGAALVASTAFSLTLANVGQYVGGHAALVGMLYAPLAILFWRRAEKDLRFAVGLGLLLAWTFLEGGGYPTAFIGLTLAIETLMRLRPKNGLAVLKGAEIALVTFAAAGAARILPVVDQLLHHKRALATEDDSISLRTLYDMYFARTHEWKVPGQTYVWPEYSAHLGAILIALALVGFVLCLRDHAWFAALGTAIFLLMLGHFSKWAPWHLLKGHVFPFRSMRVPSRFRLIFALFLGGWAGFAVDRIPAVVARWLGPRTATAVRTAVLGVALIGAGDALSIAMTRIASAYTDPPEKAVEASPRLFIGGQLAQFVDQPRQNQGRVNCWEEWNFTDGAPVWQGDVPQAKAETDAVAVRNVSRTQNTFTIDVEAKEPARVRVNTPWERGWRTDVGKIAQDHKILVVDVPVGPSRIHLWYWPQWLTLGFFLTGFGTLAAVSFVVIESRRMLRAA
jgi:uncharacterized membrane protein YfhO